MTSTTLISLALPFAVCVVTFGGGWILGLLIENMKPLLMFWAGIAYVLGLQKLMPLTRPGIDPAKPVPPPAADDVVKSTDE